MHARGHWGPRGPWCESHKPSILYSYYEKCPNQYTYVVQGFTFRLCCLNITTGTYLNCDHLFINSFIIILSSARSGPASVGSLVTDRKSSHWDGYQWKLFKALCWRACTVSHPGGLFPWQPLPPSHPPAGACSSQVSEAWNNTDKVSTPQSGNHWDIMSAFKRCGARKKLHLCTEKRWSRTAQRASPLGLHASFFPFPCKNCSRRGWILHEGRRRRCANICTVLNAFSKYSADFLTNLM